MSGPEGKSESKGFDWRPYGAVASVVLLASAYFTDNAASAYASDDFGSNQGIESQINSSNFQDQVQTENPFSLNDEEKAMLTLFVVSFWSVQAATGYKAMENAYGVNKIATYGGLVAEGAAIAYFLEKLWS